MSLTKKQQEVLTFSKDGELRLIDFYKVYSSKESLMSALNRMVLLGYIEDIGGERFKILKNATIWKLQNKNNKM